MDDGRKRSADEIRQSAVPRAAPSFSPLILSFFISPRRVVELDLRSSRSQQRYVENAFWNIFGKRERSATRSFRTSEHREISRRSRCLLRPGRRTRSSPSCQRVDDRAIDLFPERVRFYLHSLQRISNETRSAAYLSAK